MSKRAYLKDLGLVKTPARQPHQLGYVGPTPEPDGGFCDGLLVFPTTLVAPGQSAGITVQPQVPFKPRRLAIPPQIADRFSVFGYRMGASEYMFVNSGSVPASLFPPIPHGLSEEDRACFDKLLSFEWPTISVAQYLILHVVNESHEAANFNGVLWGTYDKVDQ